MDNTPSAYDCAVMNAYDTLFCPNDDVYMWTVKRTKRDQAAALALLAAYGYGVNTDKIVPAELD